jgi:hypothetical protein
MARVVFSFSVLRPVMDRCIRPKTLFYKAGQVLRFTGIQQTLMIYPYAGMLVSQIYQRAIRWRLAGCGGLEATCTYRLGLSDVHFFLHRPRHHPRRLEINKESP